MGAISHRTIPSTDKNVSNKDTDDVHASWPYNISFSKAYIGNLLAWLLACGQHKHPWVDPWPHFQHKQKQVCLQHLSLATVPGTVPPTPSPAPNKEKYKSIQIVLHPKHGNTLHPCKHSVTQSNPSWHNILLVDIQAGNHFNEKTNLLCNCWQTTIWTSLVITDQAINVRIWQSPQIQSQSDL